MTRLTHALIATLAISGLPARAAPDPTPSEPPAGSAPGLPGPPLPEGVRVPPGSRADVLLWKELLDAQNDLVIQRRRAELLLRRFNGERHDARLADLALRTEGPERKRVVDARSQLGNAWRDLSRRYTQQWPVDPRLGCRAQTYDLEGTLHAAPGSAGAAALGEARLAARSCQGKLQSVLEPLRQENRAMEDALARADAVVRSSNDAGTR